VYVSFKRIHISQSQRSFSYFLGFAFPSPNWLVKPTRNSRRGFDLRVITFAMNSTIIKLDSDAIPDERKCVMTKDGFCIDELGRNDKPVAYVKKEK